MVRNLSLCEVAHRPSFPFCSVNCFILSESFSELSICFRLSLGLLTMLGLRDRKEGLDLG